MPVGSVIRWVGGGIAVAMSLYHMWFAASAPPEAMIFRGTHLLFALVLVFLLVPGGTRGGPRRFLWLDLILVAASAVAIGYIFVNYEVIVNRIIYIDALTSWDKAMAVLTVALVLFATWRVIGWALPVTAIIFLVYAVFFANVKIEGLLEQMYLSTDGIFGSTLGVSASYVIVFVLFGAFMERSGTGRLFMDFALSLTGHTAGGPGKVAIVSSSLFGTISGSAVANVMVDGPITIPLMKKTGFRPAFAAAVEATASTGGQIMPPIMGAAAFVMAEYLAVSYFQVTALGLDPGAALLRRALLRGALRGQARGAARRAQVGDAADAARHEGARPPLHPDPAGALRHGDVLQRAALRARRRALDLSHRAPAQDHARRHQLANRPRARSKGGSRDALSVAMACACAGIVIGVISLTGLGITFTQIVIALSQNSLVLALVLTAAAGIVLGMGMPTTPAYIVMVSLLVPALVKLGVVTPAAHMFAFYFAVLSAITPPVALAVFAAAALAGANMWRAGFEAVRIAAAGFIVPFMFVYEPALLSIGSWQATALATTTAAIGVIALASSLYGYLLAPLAIWHRLVMGAGALLLIKPGFYTDLVGLGLLGMVVALQLATARRAAPSRA